MNLLDSTKLLGAAALWVSLSGCTASVHFYSKTGQDYPALAPRAVIIEDAEVDAVRAAGGYPIGTESGQGLAVDASQEDVASKAAVVAARNGGTHLLRTEQAIEQYVVQNPGHAQRSCVGGDDRVDCTTTFTPPSTSVYDKPTAKFVVFRVDPENWARLPPNLRPVPAR